MGEHIRLGGEIVKIGTCEDMYYARYEQLRAVCGGRAEKAEGNLSPAEYVNPKHGWRYRFPFPEEDGIQIGEYDDHDKGRMISVPPDAPIVMESDGHDDKSVSVSCNGTYNVNVRVPCPASEKIKAFRTSPIPENRPIEIIQQKLLEDGTLAVVVRCGWCKSAYRLEDSDEVLWLIEYLLTYDEHNASYWKEVATRIGAGYPALVEAADNLRT